MSTGHIPTIVDVDLISGGSPRLSDGRLTRSMGMTMDYLTTANAAIRDYDRVSRIASESGSGFDSFSTMDVGFGILASRLNDIAIRASELDDPVLIAILRSIGMVKGDVVSLIRMGDEESPSLLMPGLCPGKEELPSEQADAIAAAVRRGVHHDEDWTLAMQVDQTRDMDVMAWIADSIGSGNMDSTFCPKACVGRWKLHVRTDS
jgi:hypothetical protein